MRINGFRPGKVPVAHLKRLYGRSAMAEAIEAAVRDDQRQDRHRARLQARHRAEGDAARPKQAAVESMIAGKADLSYTVAIEMVPKIELADFKGIKLERLTADVTDAEIDEAVKRIAEQNRPFAAKAEGARRRERRPRHDLFHRQDRRQAVRRRLRRRYRRPDRLGHVHSGLRGSARRHGGAARPGPSMSTFPDDYLKQELAGKAAEFEVTAKSIDAPGPVAVDDAFAKSLGLESLAKLRDAVKDRLAARARRRVTRRQGQARSCWTRSTRRHKIRASRRRWSRRSSRMSGRRSWATCKRRAEPSPTKARPRKRRRRNTAGSPSGACVSAWCWPKSANAITSR